MQSAAQGVICEKERAYQRAGLFESCISQHVDLSRRCFDVVSQSFSESMCCVEEMEVAKLELYTKPFFFVHVLSLYCFVWCFVC